MIKSWPQFKKEWFSGRIQGATSLSGLWLSYSCAEIFGAQVAHCLLAYHLSPTCIWGLVPFEVIQPFLSKLFCNLRLSDCYFLSDLFWVTNFAEALGNGLAFKYQFLALPISIYSDVCHCKISAVPESTFNIYFGWTLFHLKRLKPFLLNSSLHPNL